uniref:Uncharacterized protein n=1 Tax=Arundo donax TaxID=35708 RepID=A0A0A9FUU3_ARUDO
MDWLRRVSR